MYEDNDGNRETITATPEHPFHIEEWDGVSADQLYASLSPSVAVEVSATSDDATALTPTNVNASRMAKRKTTMSFASTESTQFGDWVRAGSLKAGDQISVRDGVDETPGDKTVTVVSNTSDSTPTRVYNLEVQSNDGEITHNYFVGDEQVWVHNGRGAGWKAIFNDYNTPRHIKGWIQQELNRGRRFWNLKNPKGCDLGHHPGNPSKEGYRHGPNSRLEWTRDNRSRGGRFGR